MQSLLLSGEERRLKINLPGNWKEDKLLSLCPDTRWRASFSILLSLFSRRPSFMKNAACNATHKFPKTLGLACKHLEQVNFFTRNFGAHPSESKVKSGRFKTNICFPFILFRSLLTWLTAFHYLGGGGGLFDGISVETMFLLLYYWAIVIRREYRPRLLLPCMPKVGKVSTTFFLVLTGQTNP